MTLSTSIAMLDLARQLLDDIDDVNCNNPDIVLAQALADQFEAGRAAGPEWQPIETAPRDGTYILASPYWIGNPRADVVNWHKAQRSEGWLNIREGYIPGKPTHWLPIPEPPE